MKQISLDSDGRDTFIDATKSWQKWQIKEASRARKEDPKGIKIKHV